MSADFTPVYNDPAGLKPFRFWCQKVLPLVYDDTLSYYELLCKVVDYLNHTMEDVNTLSGDVEALRGAYVQLQDYVNTYFNNLDIQEEINNKLDEMVISGELTQILQPVISDEVAAWLAEHITPTTPAVDNTLSVSGAAADAKVTGDQINLIKSDMYAEIEAEDVSFLSNKHEGYGLSNNVAVSNAWLSYTDYIEIPTNAESITVRTKTIDGSNQEFRIAPSMYVYDANKTVLKTYTISEIYDFRTHPLTIAGAKYIRVVQPSARSSASKYMRFNFKNAVNANSENITNANYSSYFTNANNAPSNMCYTIEGLVTEAMVSNLPRYGYNSTLLTLAGVTGAANVKAQLFFDRYGFMLRTQNYDQTWNEWKNMASISDIPSFAQGMITSSNYTDYFTDFNNAPINTMYEIQATVTGSMISHMPVQTLPTQAILMTLCGVADSTTLNMHQIFWIGSGGAIYTRSSNYNRTQWSPWLKIEHEETYHVGPGREYTSLTQCLYDLRNNYNKKTIYVDGGTYDIFQEYSDANIPVIPDDGDYNNNYTPYNVWVPANTHLIGLGNVVLDFSPEAAQISDAESKTVSPLNVHFSCVIENVTVYCKNGRYCIHADGQGGSAYSDSVIVLKNVECYRTENDPNKGWGEVVGIGLDKRQLLTFENCSFKRSTSGANFYAHNRDLVGGQALATKESSTLIIDGCVFENPSGSDSIRLASGVTTNLLNIKTKVIDSYLEGNLHLSARTTGAANCFNVTVLNSGSVSPVIDDSNNQYPVKVLNN